jgi:hypothetical protein
MRQAIIESIQHRRRLRVVCKGLVRIVEPYLLFESKGGAEILHGWQVAGEFTETPPPDWCNLKLTDISDARNAGAALRGAGSSMRR